MPYDGITPELAWAIGLYEGEGCTWVSHNNTHRGKPSRSFAVGLAITSTDVDVLERFAAAVGGPGRIFGPKNPGNRPGTRPVYQWQTASLPEIKRILKLFYPLLGERRRAKADEILALERR